ncbi:hypothetical protein PVK06_045199 [Gossypium arboreum]|uniref:RNase H type-1 domain-containing protein n=1 Tax=Gossypium arboreum TaxID=29729 RepID=A0ABR0MTU9_GOSAR|nr:hypothetical protein PVK06_045199 [Gossypium arboreum]
MNTFICQDVTWMALETVKVSLSWAQQFDFSHRRYQHSPQANASRAPMVNTRVQRIMRTEGQWCIGYVPREFNEIADCQTKLSLVGKSSLQIYDGTPNEVLELVQQDKTNNTFVQFNLM